MRDIFRSDDYPVTERFEGYRAALSRVIVPVDVRAEPDTMVRVLIRGMRVGPVDLSAISAADNAVVEIDRPQRLVRRSDPEAFRLLVGLRGRTEMTQGDRSPRLAARQMAFYDTSRPFRGWRRGEDGGFALTMLTFPRDLLPVPAKLVKGMIGVPVDGRGGAAALLVAVLLRLQTGSDEYAGADGHRIATVLADLLTAVLGQAGGEEATRTMSPESRNRVLHARIHAFIHERLGDPDLTPQTIATAHHISVRLLHRLFQEQDTTVAGAIRGARLDRCRTDLAEPLCNGWTIGQIAARRGFVNYTHFSRLFRATYGVSPSDWRRLHHP